MTPLNLKYFYDRALKEHNDYRNLFNLKALIESKEEGTTKGAKKKGKEDGTDEASITLYDLNVPVEDFDASWIEDKRAYQGKDEMSQQAPGARN